MTLPSGPTARITGIQGLRALAIVLVVAYHADVPIGSGFLGVDIFFVISGFVITRLLITRSQETGRFSLKEFWSGRIRRLLPALALMVIVTALVSIPLASPLEAQKTVAFTGVSASVWVSNALLALLTLGYFAPVAAENPLLHTWSLAVEEQFYAIFPIVVALALWASRLLKVKRVRVVATFVVLVTLVSFALCVLLTFSDTTTTQGQRVAFFSPFTRAWEFGAGSLLALALVRTGGTDRRKAGGRFPEVLGAAAIVGLVASLVLVDDPTVFPGYVAVLPVIATVALIWAVVKGTRVTRVLSSKPAVYLGDISYSWYLWHWPVLVYVRAQWPNGDVPWFATGLAVVLSLVLADLSYRFLEEPIRHRARLPRMGAPTLTLLAVVPTIAACAVVAVGSQQHWGSQTVEAYEAAFVVETPPGFGKECQSLKPLTERDQAQCTRKGSSKAPGIILMGDSNARMYKAALLEATDGLDRTASVGTVSGCAFVDVSLLSGDRRSWLDCHAQYRASLEWLRDQPPSIVLIASVNATIDSDDVHFETSTGDVAHSTAAKSEMWSDGLRKTFRDVRAAGSTPVLVTVAPQFLDSDGWVWSPQKCGLLRVLKDAASCGMSWTSERMDRRQTLALEAERRAVAGSGVPVISFRDQLCPAGLCSTNTGDAWHYYDGAHISDDAARRLAPFLVGELRRIDAA